ncbi:DUF2345 domain-containing protein, partial [Curvibacter sp. CHRR-16]|uniref:DUF2345 domain-containing protein n=1 Tax=Curvibacter sp. CHRR-16 TaxID=2835872 RepID=UPI001BD9AFB3
GGHVSVSTAKSWLLSAKEAIKLFAYKAGIKLVSAKEDIDIQALKTSIHLLAKQEVSFTANEIILQAQKKVVLNGASSYMQWQASGVEEATTGSRTVHANQLGVVGPDNRPLPSPVLPAADWKPPQNQLVFTLMTQPDQVGGALRAGEPYRLLKAGAVIDQGITNELGQVIVKNHQDGTSAYQVQLSNGAVFDLKVVEALGHSPEHKLGNKGFRTTATSQDRAVVNGLVSPTSRS